MSGLHFAAIAFDFDGVLVESVDVKTQAFAQLYRPYGEAIVAQVVDYHLANGGVSRYEKFRHYHRVLLGKALLQDEEDSLAARFSDLVEEAVIASPPVPGALAFLEAHAERLPLYVVSGTPHDELQRIVERRGMRRFFKGVFGSPQSKADLLRGILAAEALAPAQLLMVGDATTDHDGAQQAGTAFIGRVVPGATNPFPGEVPVIGDLTALPGLV